jgi:hypothetical protein
MLHQVVAVVAVSTVAVADVTARERPQEIIFAVIL